MSDHGTGILVAIIAAYAVVAFGVAITLRRRPVAARIAIGVAGSVVAGGVFAFGNVGCEVVKGPVDQDDPVFYAFAGTLLFGSFIAVLLTLIGIVPAVVGAWIGSWFFRRAAGERPRAE